MSRENELKHLYKPGCSGKKRFKNLGNAMVNGLRASKKIGALRPYSCQYCNGWHLTSKVKTIKQ